MIVSVADTLCCISLARIEEASHAADNVSDDFDKPSLPAGACDTNMIT